VRVVGKLGRFGGSEGRRIYDVMACKSLKLKEKLRWLIHRCSSMALLGRQGIMTPIATFAPVEERDHFYYLDS
jgi:hypothetical protein